METTTQQQDYNRDQAHLLDQESQFDEYFSQLSADEQDCSKILGQM